MRSDPRVAWPSSPRQAAWAEDLLLLLLPASSLFEASLPEGRALGSVLGAVMSITTYAPGGGAEAVARSCQFFLSSLGEW